MSSAGRGFTTEVMQELDEWVAAQEGSIEWGPCVALLAKEYKNELAHKDFTHSDEQLMSDGDTTGEDLKSDDNATGEDLKSDDNATGEDLKIEVSW